MRKLIFLIALLFNALHAINAQPGKTDSSFAVNGVLRANLGTTFNYGIGEAKKVLFQPGGNIFIVSTNSGKTRISKRLQDGSLDSAYGQSGLSAIVFMQGTDAVMQADGKIVAVGYNFIGDVGDANNDFVVARYNLNGSLDSSFSTDGVVTTNFWDENSASIGVDDYANSVAVQPDGKIVVAGSTTGNNFEKELAIARYHADGNLDSSFCGDGKLKTADNTTDVYANSVAIQKDSKILVAGPVLFRYDSNGNLDKTFSNDGMKKQPFVVHALGIQRDGKIVVAGSSNLARYTWDGDADNTFSGDGTLVNSFSIAFLDIAANGKIIVGGSSALARYNSNGTPDNTFDGDGKRNANFSIASLGVQSNGQIVAGGSSLARYNVNGSVDKSFNQRGEKLNFAIGGTPLPSSKYFTITPTFAGLSP